MLSPFGKVIEFFVTTLQLFANLSVSFFPRNKIFFVTPGPPDPAWMLIGVLTPTIWPKAHADISLCPCIVWVWLELDWSGLIGHRSTNLCLLRTLIQDWRINARTPRWTRLECSTHWPWVVPPHCTHAVSLSHALSLSLSPQLPFILPSNHRILDKQRCAQFLIKHPSNICIDFPHDPASLANSDESTSRTTWPLYFSVDKLHLPTIMTNDRWLKRILCLPTIVSEAEEIRFICWRVALLHCAVLCVCVDHLFGTCCEAVWRWPCVVRCGHAENVGAGRGVLGVSHQLSDPPSSMMFTSLAPKRCY